MSCWLNPRERGLVVVQEVGDVTISPTLLGPVMMWSQQNYLKLLKTLQVFSVFLVQSF